MFATSFLRLETLLGAGVPKENCFCGTLACMKCQMNINYKMYCLEGPEMAEGRHVITDGSYRDSCLKFE